MTLSVFQAFYRSLVGNLTIADAVGTRIFEGIYKGNTKPYILVEYLKQEDPTISGRDYDMYDVTITVVAATPQDADSVLKAVDTQWDRQSWSDSNISVIYAERDTEGFGVESDNNPDALNYERVGHYEFLIREG